MPVAGRAATWKPHVLRWLVNLGILLGVTLLLSVGAREIPDAPRESIGDTAAIVLFAWYVITWQFLPGAAVYLVLLELVPTRWSHRARRTAALLLSPIASAFLWFYVIPFADTIVTAAAFVLGTSLLYGALVRLRPAGEDPGPRTRREPAGR